MRYHDLEIESILKLGRAAREMGRNTTSTEYSETDHLALLAETFEGRTLTLVELLIDYEERIADFGEHWRRWRRKRRERKVETMEKPDAKLFDPNAPQVEYQEVPEYYESHDIPHVLARVRAGDRFFDEVVEEKFRVVYSDLYHEHLETLKRELQPYALDLALSLISLEDSLRKDRKEEDGE